MLDDLPKEKVDFVLTDFILEQDKKTCEQYLQHIIDEENFENEKNIVRN
jgi:hypothetical protein